MTRSWPFALALALTIASPITSHAAPNDAKQRATESFKAASIAFKRGEFAIAAAAFEQAALYVPHPSTLLNAAEAWELASNHVRAAELCDRVLETEGAADARHREIATEQLKRLAKKIATLDVEVPPNARVTIDAEREEAGPRHVRLTPGSHAVAYVDPSTATTHHETIVLVAGETRKFEPPKADAPAPTSPVTTAILRSPEQPASSAPPLASWIAFGTAAAAGGAAGYFGYKAGSTASDFDANPSPTLRDDFHQAVIATDVSLGIAAAAAVVGVVVWLTHRSH